MLRSELASRFSTEGPRIHVIQACWCDSAASLVRYDEFGLPSSAQPWSAQAMAYLALREIGQHAEVTATGPDVPYATVPGTLLVDFPASQGLDLRGTVIAPRQERWNHCGTTDQVRYDRTVSDRLMASCCPAKRGRVRSASEILA